MSEETGPAGNQRVAIFLRGVNVGGVTVRMADLRDELAGLPLDDVRTVLASGNVTCSTTLARTELRACVEGALRTRFGYDAWVVVVGRAELVAIAAAVPQQPVGPETDGDTTTGSATGMHTYVTLFRSTADAGAFLDEARGLGEQAAVLPGGTAMAWFSPRGRSTDVPLARLLAKARYAPATTTRNITTIEKVLRLLA